MSDQPSQADYFHSNPAEMLAWEEWRRGYARCPYCRGLEPRDWIAICDCWMAERVLPPSVVGLPQPQVTPAWPFP